MKRTFQIILILFVCQTTVLGFRYNPNWNNFARPLPFSEEELAAFKAAKVQSIGYSLGEKEQSTFSFNEIGQLTYEYALKSGEYRGYAFTYEGKYRYNQAGQLTSYIYGNDKNRTYDSITYNEQGRIVAYSSYVLSKVKRKFKKHIYYDAKFLKTENNNFVLIDNSPLFDLRTFTLDSNNQLIKTKGISMNSPFMDSLSFETDSIGLYHIKHWGVRTLNSESIYKNGLLISEGSGSFIYNYDKENRLLSIIPLGYNTVTIYQPRVFFIYNSEGLVKEKITVYARNYWKEHKPDLQIENFTYHF